MPLSTAALSDIEYLPPRISRALLGALGAGLATVAATGALTVLRGDDGRALDVPLGRRLRGGRPRGRPSPVERLLDALAGREESLAVAAAVALLLGRRHGAAALALVASTFGVHAAHRALRLAVDRPRPLLARLAGKRTPSFPSGHAARAAALFGTLAHVAARDRVAPGAVTYPVAIGLAAAAGLARVKRGRHWTTDVVGGLGLGVAAAAAGAIWYDERRKG
ncbi:phosphoesterase PA-phosphatase related protein [Gemmatirosa kalamazoonensis]|uniref:Phosphoesterase PA-phosphatase related protein n=1 Tax=Gemmatirosa kalamazoonensis TaxID=861299 RepID=W0RDI5_9BACT|nr:phosphatase PAP2 family protein [Gemmatirosa kalamazoonensis]AHG89169.1 phosphoesterase PA-phosphatase related protein [Gemmatirosa kalamazoonensis]